jgi:hypothetical protein
MGVVEEECEMEVVVAAEFRTEEAVGVSVMMVEEGEECCLWCGSFCIELLHSMGLMWKFGG